jgi:alpha-glucosidase (family GH31 glycosyl hydrolase)
MWGRRSIFFLITVLSSGAVATSASADEVVRSGVLRATVHADPWRIELTDPGGGSVVDQPDSQNLGFHTATGWTYAVRATSLRRQGKGIRATVATDDPLGGTLDVTIAPAGQDSIRVTATATGADPDSTEIAFGAMPDERFTGFGERSNFVDARGQDVDNYVSDGPYPERARDIISVVGLPWAETRRDDATYFPVPWTLSSRGYGVLLENDERSTFHMESQRPGVWSIEPEAATVSVRIFPGPTPAKALKRYTAATGRTPAAQAPWAYGPWFQTGQPNFVPVEDERTWIETLRAADAPVSVGETQLHYLPCGANTRQPESEAERTKNFHSHGLARLVYFNPLICTDYEPVYSQAAAAGGLQRDATGDPYTYPAYVGGEGPAGFTVKPLAQFDFTSEGGARVYDQLLRQAVNDGADGWMEDFGEYTPLDAVSADGTPGTQMHNRYPTTYHCAVRDFQDASVAKKKARPLVRFSRSGWTGSAACVDNVWGGDPTTVWDFDGLSSAIKQALTIGASGISRWGSDIGGYHTFGPDEQLDRELLARWIEFGAASPVMRTKASGLELPPYDRPQIWEPESIRIWRTYAKLHTQLNPYLRGADAIYRKRGMPIVRGMLLAYPGDARAVGLEDQYLLGPSLLVAPAITPGAEQRSLYLPHGRWLEFWKALRFGGHDGDFRMKRPRVVKGKRRLNVKTPLDRLPLMVRAGAIIPLLPADVDTLADYGKGRGLVHLDDRAGRMHLLVFPRGDTDARMNEGERLRSREPGGKRWRLRIDGARRRTYDIEVAMATLEHRFTPAEVRVDGKPLPRVDWSYRRDNRVLTARVRCRICTVVTRAKMP